MDTVLLVMVVGFVFVQASETAKGPAERDRHGMWAFLGTPHRQTFPCLKLVVHALLAAYWIIAFARPRSAVLANTRATRLADRSVDQGKTGFLKVFHAVLLWGDNESTSFGE